jgi:hypothetical protein
VRIFSLAGFKVKEFRPTNGRLKGNASFLPQGLYLAQVVTAKTVQQFKLLF